MSLCGPAVVSELVSLDSGIIFTLRSQEGSRRRLPSSHGDGMPYGTAVPELATEAFPLLALLLHAPRVTSLLLSS